MVKEWISIWVLQRRRPLWSESANLPTKDAACFKITGFYSCNLKVHTKFSKYICKFSICDLIKSIGVGSQFGFYNVVVPFEVSQQIFQPKMLQASKLQDYVLNLANIFVNFWFEAQMKSIGDENSNDIPQWTKFKNLFGK